MAIRVRRHKDGQLVALCAAKSTVQKNDLYLDDEVHYALAQKFWRDYEEITVCDEDDINRAKEYESQTSNIRRMNGGDVE